jgi:hypothetical protein
MAIVLTLITTLSLGINFLMFMALGQKNERIRLMENPKIKELYEEQSLDFPDVYTGTWGQELKKKRGRPLGSKNSKLRIKVTK